ncbi:MAG: hypothetical protein ACREHE_03635 [Rhizomicrobium sp.]
MSQQSQSPEPRGCDGCTLCCKIFPVEPLNKPANVLCTHCIADTGCGIFGQASRPAVCGEFRCGYLMEPQLGPEWKPSVSHIVLLNEGLSMVAGVDADVPDAWRREPYYSVLRNWARIGGANGANVMISTGSRLVQLMPDGSELAIRIANPKSAR